MSKVASAAGKAIDWASVASKLKLDAATASAIANFRSRHAQAVAKLGTLREQATTVDFATYRSVLANKEIVNRIESSMKSFKPVKIDLNSQLKAINAFEAKASEGAKKNVELVKAELQNLSATLKNIEQARPTEEITIEDMKQAVPEIEKIVETMVTKGKWVIPGYREKFGDLSIM
ncbi:F1-FO ATP synthase subunit D [Schizosaccharomyces pombe]|uniref:ATP synthase subunit d, mitochondrial n=1 Tax=Schizosaccharomyces pombe (strain 972 / ATCC 24843) TaxID=284812 RepID=ATP7_SCHPO|nr:putative F0-ATPase subunit D [Schizosaccharomyces pombe]O94390.3 RecName: Full=ATP synthase subunit d, mitochondrial [Schizosaccharomyces pombe 972h-]CAA22441.1 F0-ATPase subunit D (predicted) [Schizosaccharomyces pombe]|eukprot:NP_596058.1 putative F0-ATPase subunit D [Schizosaccharomyces pombe]